MFMQKHLFTRFSQSSLGGRDEKTVCRSVAVPWFFLCLALPRLASPSLEIWKKKLLYSRPPLTGGENKAWWYLSSSWPAMQYYCASPTQSPQSEIRSLANNILSCKVQSMCCFVARC